MMKLLSMMFGRFQSAEVEFEPDPDAIADHKRAHERLSGLRDDPDLFLECQINVLKAHAVSFDGFPTYNPYRFFEDRRSGQDKGILPEEAIASWWAYLEANNIYLNLKDRDALIARLAIGALRTPSRLDDHDDMVFWFFEFLRRAGFDEATTFRAVDDTLESRSQQPS